MKIRKCNKFQVKFMSQKQMSPKPEHLALNAEVLDSFTPTQVSVSWTYWQNICSSFWTVLSDFLWAAVVLRNVSKRLRKTNSSRSINPGVEIIISTVSIKKQITDWGVQYSLCWSKAFPVHSNSSTCGGTNPVYCTDKYYIQSYHKSH